VKINAFCNDKKQIDIEEPIIKKQHLHIDHHNVSIVPIGHKPKEHHNKHKIHTHLHHRAKERRTSVARQHGIWISLIHKCIYDDANEFIPPKEVYNVKHCGLSVQN